MGSLDSTRISGIATAVPRRVFLSHTSDLGKHTEPGSFVAVAVEAVLRARHAVSDMAYIAARDNSPAAVCREIIAVGVCRDLLASRCGPSRSRPT